MEKFFDDSLDYLGLNESDIDSVWTDHQIGKLSLKPDQLPISINNFSFTNDVLSHFSGNKAVLGHWTPDQKLARANNMRYEPYSEMSRNHFASSTIGLPGTEGAMVARAVCERLCQIKEGSLSDQDKLNAMEALVASISNRGLEVLCNYYDLPVDQAEVMFDDNATMALYQFMSYLGLRKYDTTLTFFDTGRVIPMALRGTNPQHHGANFRPSIDIFGNQNRLNKLKTRRNLSQSVLFNIEHFIDEQHQTDEQLMEDIAYIVQTSRPKVLLIPSVTRLGRKIDFLKIGKMVSQIGKSSSGHFNSWLILDDAQGVLRLDKAEYSGVWDSYDAILQTGAKATGALLGAGAILFNKEKFKNQQIPFADSKLRYRTNRYGFMSSDADRVQDFNRHAHGVLNAPELTSLIIELGKFKYTESADKLTGRLKDRLIQVLNSFPEHIRVLDTEGGVNYVNSIIGFYFKKANAEGVGLKSQLANSDSENEKIILPALVTPENDQDPVDHYLRIALDPKQCIDSKKADEYKKKISYLCRRLREVIWGIISNE